MPIDRNNQKRAASDELPLQPPEKRGLRDDRLTAGHEPSGQWDANIVANTSYTLEQLQKLYGMRLCGGRTNKDVRETVEQVYNQFPEHHKFIYCVIQAALALTDHDRWEFYQFVFHKRLHLDTMIDEIFADAESQWNRHATRLDQTTKLLLVHRWNYVIAAIGHRIKLQLHGNGYPLCPCQSSQPHAIHALRESVSKPKLQSRGKIEIEENAELVITAFTTLRTLDMLKVTNKKNKDHDVAEERELAHKALDYVRNISGLSTDIQAELDYILKFPIECSLLVLKYHEVDASDYVSYCLSWKIRTLSPIITVGGIKYYKRTILIPFSDIINGKADIYDDTPEPNDDGIYDYGYGLFGNNEDNWYEIDDNQFRLEQDEVEEGDDGEKYRRCKRGLFDKLFLGRREELKIRGLDDLYIAHLVLVDFEATCLRK